MCRQSHVLPVNFCITFCSSWVVQRSVIYLTLMVIDLYFYSSSTWFEIGSNSCSLHCLIFKQTMQGSVYNISPRGTRNESMSELVDGMIHAWMYLYDATEEQVWVGNFLYNRTRILWGTTFSVLNEEGERRQIVSWHWRAQREMRQPTSLSITTGYQICDTRLCDALCKKTSLPVSTV